MGIVMIMEILNEYDFKRQSTSRYAPAVKALVDDGAFAVKLRRGVDFPQDVRTDNVQANVSNLVRARGKRARTFVESDDVVVVSLWPDGEGPKQRRKAAKRSAAAVG